MSYLLNHLQGVVNQLHLEPINDFTTRLKNTSDLKILTGIRSNLDSLSQDIYTSAILTDSSFGSYHTLEDRISIEWYADHYGSNSINIDFYGGGGKWKSVWSMDTVLEAVHSIESGIAKGQLPDTVFLQNITAKVTLSKLTSNNPELYISDLFEAHVTDQSAIASFIVGLLIDVRRVLVGARIDEVYK